MVEKLGKLGGRIDLGGKIVDLVLGVVLVINEVEIFIV